MFSTLEQQLKIYLQQSNEILNKKSLNKQDRQDLQDIIDFLCTEYVATNAALNYVECEFIKTVGKTAYYQMVSPAYMVELMTQAQAGLMLDESSDEI